MRRAHDDSNPPSRFRRDPHVWLFHLPPWWRRYVALFAAALIAFTLVWASRGIKSMARDGAPRSSFISGHTVVIDAGHGGVDPGAVGRDGLEEKTVTLPIARELERLLNRAAVYTIMVRREDEDLADPGLQGFSKRKRQDIGRRIQLANAKDADLYVSIHANSFPGGPWYGAQTFYAPGDPGGKVLARAIQAALVERLGPNKRGAKSGEYAVLERTEMPAAIVEVGFLSHPEEAAKLSHPQYQREVAEAIYNGIIEYWVSDREPEPVPVNEGATDAGSAPPALPVGRQPGRVWLYAVGTGENGAPILVPINRPLVGVGWSAGPEAVATAALEELIHLSQGSGRDGPTGPLPEGTRLLGLRVEGGTAIADFSSELRSAKLRGATSEALTVYAIVNTLTLIQGIDRVVITVDGARVITLGGHLFPDPPLEWDSRWVARKDA